MEVFTLGTSNRSLKEFFEILKKYKIKAVVDVRHFPTSKLFPHFKKENLEKFLKEKKIEYFHLEKLGGYREGGYENYIKTKDFEEGLENLIKIAKKQKTAIVCAERLPWKCHRAFISQRLENKNFKVIHIIEKKQNLGTKERKKGNKANLPKRKIR